MKDRSVKEAVIQNIRSTMVDFGLSELDLIERISVILDTTQFNYKEDESVWKQKRDKAPKVCEVYFDNVWICDLYETDPHEFARLKFLKGFQNGYESGKIRLNRFLASLQDELTQEVEKNAKREQKKALDNLPQSTPEEKAAKEIVTELIQEKNETSAQLPTAT